MQTIEHLLSQRLHAAFKPAELQLINESHLHAGHSGSEGGGQHWRVKMQAAAFATLNRVAQHRAVYAAAGDLLQQDVHSQGYIHALALELRS